MLRAMVGVGMLCGLLIVGVFILTKPVIEANRAAALQEAILTVLPAAERSVSFVPLEEGGFRVADEKATGPRVYAGYDASGALVGLAFEGAGMGYQDVIRVLWGYDPTAERVVGLAVLESRETPGLGDKIVTDEDFVSTFSRLDVSLNDERTALLHPVEGVKGADVVEAWQIDAISGATISSMAIADILAESTARWLPRVQRHLGDFEQVGAS